MTDTVIDYDRWIEEALTAVVRRALRVAAAQGLYDNHHFYITFDTKAAGVAMSDHLRARYPEEMTIVLQHQYDDLLVDEARVSVTVYFGGKPERLTVPFAAMTGFADPSVNFGLQLRMTPMGPEEDGASEPPVPVDPDIEEGDNVVTLDAFRGKKK
jgi:hypothetical protein